MNVASIPFGNTKHTPGPWAVAEGDGCFVVETDDMTVRFVCMGLDAEGDRANACLIAAAPDLLEALRRVVNDWVAPDGLPFEDGEMPALDAARAAIAKATGGES